MPVPVGAKSQGQAQGGGGSGELGDLADGTYPIVLRWGIKVFPEGGQFPGGPKLSLFVEGNGITERLGGGNGRGIELSKDFKSIEACEPGWQLNSGCKAAAFLCEFEKALGGELEDTMLAYDGTQVEIRRMRYSGKVGDKEANKPGGPTYPVVLKATAPSRAQAAPPPSPALAPPTPQPVPAAPPDPTMPFGILGSPVPPGTPTGPLPGGSTPEPMPTGPLQTVPPVPPNVSPAAWARETVMAMLTANNSQPIAMAQVQPDAIVEFLPAVISNDTDRMEVVKLVMTPDFLQGEMGWKYDAGTHVVSSDVPF